MNAQPQDIVLLGGLLVATVTDIRWGRIPNALTFPMMALGIAINAAVGRDGAPPDVLLGLIGCAAGFALHFPLFAFGIEKGGDAKLLMAVGALMGWRGMLETTIWYAVLYLPVGLAVLAARGRLWNLVAAARWVFDKARGRPVGDAPEQTRMIAGPTIAVAGLLAIATDWFERVV